MNTYNPDVLQCLANLSNDEVFTPPQLANEVLDLLPEEIWSDPNIKFLDPCCKTGVFLREITIRLLKGLEDQIPDLQERINHILTHQVYGIAITELTTLTTRRTLYCSKDANGEYSVCTTFGHSGGNIYYRRIEHDWKEGKCSICGASQKEFERSIELETYAYAFIHKPIEELFNMKFDVIIGNPPYQLKDGGGTGSSAKPLYHKFIQKAKELNPKYITMIIPSRWFVGGKGLDEFRQTMLNDRRIKYLVDFPNSKECFPGNDIKGGICYFLWDTQYEGDCEIRTVEGSVIEISKRPLLEEGMDTFIRENKGISILRKIQQFGEESFSSLISNRKPFGLESTYKGVDKKTNERTILLYGNKKRSYISETEVLKNKELIKMHKLLVSKAIGSGNTKTDWIKPFIARPFSCCTETYLILHASTNKDEIENILTYTQTKFFHFLMGLKKITQNTTKSTYSFVPMQDFSKPWTDTELYEKYELTPEEINYIESIIRPTGISDTKEG